MFFALWQYRNFVYSSIRNEFINRFARSALGGLWMIINPLIQVTIFAMVLSTLFAAKLPGIDNPHAYALYLMAGTLVWSLFTETITRCMTLFIEQGEIIKKIRFPRITLPVILMGSTLLNNLLLFASILLIFALLGHQPTLEVLWIPLLTALLVTLSLGIGLILGVFNVFIRDIAQIVPVLLQITYWLTPIVYPVTIIPDKFKVFLAYNPIYPIVTAYQNVLVYGTPPDVIPLMKLAGLSIFLLGVSMHIFRRASPEMVDML